MSVTRRPLRYRPTLLDDDQAARTIRGRTGGGQLKGSYCDITRPAVLRGTELLVEDLDLDLWVSAGGTSVLRLDEDEFEESGLADRDPSAADAAVRALDELEHLARTEGLAGLAGQENPSASRGARRVQDPVHHRVDRLTAEEPAEFLHAVPPL